MNSLSVRLTPDALLDAWRPRSDRLVLVTPGAPRLGARLAARVHLEGCAQRATVLGSVASVLLGPTGHRVELVPDRSGLAALRFLVSSVEGRGLPFRQRPPRHLTRLPAVLRSVAVPVYMDTHCVSSDGCRLHWSGPPPETGQPLDLRLGAGPFAAEVAGLVRWVRASQASVTVGVAFAGGATVAWSRWVERVAELGAPIL